MVAPHLTCYQVQFLSPNKCRCTLDQVQRWQRGQAASRGKHMELDVGVAISCNILQWEHSSIEDTKKTQMSRVFFCCLGFCTPALPMPLSTQCLRGHNWAMVKSLSFWQSDNSGLRQSLRNPYVFQCFAYVSALTIIRLTIRLRQAVNNISNYMA